MLLGIDVGGTFTDAVLVDNGAVYAQAKRPTTHGEVLRGILGSAGCRYGRRGRGED